MSTMKYFRKCAVPGQRYLTPDDDTIFALCVWAKSTHALFSREQSAFIVSVSH